MYFQKGGETSVKRQEKFDCRKQGEGGKPELGGTRKQMQQEDGDRLYYLLTEFLQLHHMAYLNLPLFID